jgi:hypothetical protein
MAATDYLSESSMDYLTGLLKDLYSPLMINAAKKYTYILNWLEKNKQTQRMGYSMKVPVILANSESVAPGTSTGTVPAPIDPRGTTLTITSKTIRGSLRVWHHEVVYSDSDREAFINAQQQKIKGLAETLQGESEIYCYGDGGATPRCIATDATNSNGVITLTVDSTRLLRPNMPLDFKESNGDAITNGTYVLVRDIISDTQFTVDVGSANGEAFASAAADAYIYHANGKDAEPYGLEGLIGTTSNTLFGVNRTTVGNEFYLPIVKRIDSSGAMVAATAPSATGTTLQPWEVKYLFQLIETLVKQRQAPKDKLVVFTSPSLQAKLVQDNRALGIAQPLQKKVDVWPEDVIEVSGVPVIGTYLSRPGAIFIPCLSEFYEYMTDDYNWDTVGGMWKQSYDQATARMLDAKDAFFRKIYELAVHGATKCATLYDCQGAYD